MYNKYQQEYLLILGESRKMKMCYFIFIQSCNFVSLEETISTLTDKGLINF